MGTREKWEINTKYGEKSISLSYCCVSLNQIQIHQKLLCTLAHKWRDRSARALLYTWKGNPINLFVSFWLPIRVVSGVVAHITGSKLMLRSFRFLYQMNFNFSMLLCMAHCFNTTVNIHSCLAYFDCCCRWWLLKMLPHLVVFAKRIQISKHNRNHIDI